MADLTLHPAGAATDTAGCNHSATGNLWLIFDLKYDKRLVNARVARTLKELEFLVHLQLGLLRHCMSDSRHCHALLLQPTHTLR